MNRLKAISPGFYPQRSDLINNTLESSNYNPARIVEINLYTALKTSRFDMFTWTDTLLTNHTEEWA